MKHVIAFSIPRCSAQAGCLALLLLSIQAVPAGADTVYLKNGHKIEGIIKSEKNNRLILDIGVGAMTLKQESIDRVERSGDNLLLQDQWKKKHILHPKYVPAGLEQLAKQFHDLENRREAVIKAQESSAQNENVESRLDNEIFELHRKLAGINRMLADADAEKDPREYNKLVAENNTAQSEIVIKQDSLKKIRNAKTDNQATIQDYLSVLNEFREAFDNAGSDDALLVQDKYRGIFFSEINRKMMHFSSEFSEDTVGAVSIGGNTIVKVLINGLVSGKFILDTGASLVSISEDLASRLAIPLADAPETTVVLADGTKSKAKLVLLKSIALGNIKLNNVQAVVLPAPPANEVNGLLGMSFLRHFLVSYDARAGILKVTRFNACNMQRDPPN